MKIVNAKFQTVYTFKQLIKELRVSSGKLSDRDKQRFFACLAKSLRSGLDLCECFEDVLLPEIPDKYAYVVKRIKSRVAAGQSLSKAIKGTDKFARYDVFCIQTAEKSASPATLVDELAMYYRNKISHNSSIKNRLIYPAFISCTSLLLSAVLLFPMPTALFFPVVLLMVAAGLFLYSNKDSRNFRHLTSKFIIMLPGVGNLVCKIYLLRLCQMLNVMSNASIPLQRALPTAGKMIGFYPMEVSLLQLEKEMINGKSIKSCLMKFSIYPLSFLHILQDEESPKLNLNDISQSLAIEISKQRRLFHYFAEPVILVFLVLVAGFSLF